MRTLSPQTMEVDRIIPYARNAKQHPKEQIDKIARQISEVGFLVPIIVDKNLVVIAGHGRLAAAKALGLPHVPVMIAEHLSEEQAMAFRIADNKVAESVWDTQLLGFELGSLERLNLDLTLTGFDMAEAREILGKFQGPEPTPDPNFAPGTSEDQSQIDQKKLITCPSCGCEFSPGT